MQKSVEIKSGNLTLRGSLHIPDKISDKIPLIILLHGFGGNKTGPHFMFVKLSRLLESKGIASLRFDFAGTGESDGEFLNMTLSGEVQDSTNILDYAKSLEFVDSKRIGVIGFSMGGAVASVLAGLRGEDVKSLCLWAPAGNMKDIVINDFIGAGLEEFEKKGYYDYEGLPISRELIKDLNSIDVYAKASGYHGRILLIHGDSDEIVSLSASEKYLEYYGEKASLVVVGEADHMFSRKEWEGDVISNSLDFFESL